MGSCPGLFKKTMPIKISKPIIINPTPVNRVALKVLGRGIHYAVDAVPSVERIIPRPFGYKPVPSDPSFTDYTGERRGSFRVLGFLGRKTWAVECLCGRIEKIKTKALRDQPFEKLKCGKCLRFDFVIRRGKAKEASISSINSESVLVSIPPTIAYPERKSQINNFTGKYVLSLFVVGLVDATSGKEKWLVRCQCGNHELRRKVTLKYLDERNQYCNDCSKKLYPPPSEAERYRIKKQRKAMKFSLIANKLCFEAQAEK